MSELVFFRRGEEVLRFALDGTRVVLGRGERSDVVIPDPEVSRQQVALSFDGTAFRLEDLSGKGTRVGGHSVREAPLTDGADIQLGQWRAVFRLRGGSEGEAATAVGEGHTELQAREQPRWQPAQVRVRQAGGEAVHRLSGESFTVGKDAGNDLVLQDRFISGRHLKVTRNDAVFHVVDQQSTNGTFLGPVRIFDVEVPLPTTLRVGETELVLEAALPASAAAAKKDSAFHGILGQDASMRQLTELIQRVAPSSAAVAILGESGTGKELVARALHACSGRAGAPLIPVNCAAISKELIESELFGHEKGSFTGATNARKGAFEEADGGTLFLDEIGELPLDLQAKLLRALESGEIKRVGASRPMNVDVRVVAATNRDLLAAAREGKFREDLYYRLCVIPLHLPPLRNRRGDVLALAEHFVRTFAPKGQSVRLTPAAAERLQAHAWPGNVRELRNVVHRALLLRKGTLIEATDLTFDQEMNPETGISVPEMPPGMTLEQMLEKLERQIVEQTLRRCGNNRERVARELGVARSTLFKRLKDWGLTRQDEAE
ncbi:FHA domain-containing protein [Aggregicoccus sp. 17bor-14]|uniref:sigma 54-interacting transcriptional regulator n=1 Tax=Myxococcaceae TaxID=31 RepID=UPI00129C21B9|nr:MULTISPECIES: sigma 54-interacting transcriptional regulator [Myxococcaceae]MBF5044896.1 sigma 54-interacting transcriptional regulator [Simulacricoccus sp. 17bor-14]MRI90640.1 FHA domain-containing protein [Aggregicoccus sp. 17bor-14]